MKLIYFYETKNSVLTDLDKDSGEKTDLSVDQPKVAGRLEDELMKYLNEVEAQLPAPNPNYDPSKPSNTSSRGRRRRRAG